MQEHYLEPKSSQDLLWKICDYLDLKDVHALLSTSKKMRAQLINDNGFWESQFKEHFPHRGRGKLKVPWFLVFKKTYIDDYYPYDSNPETNQKRAALFSAAKSDNKDQFKAVLRDVSIKKATLLLDRSRYNCFDWLYKKNDQSLLDDVFDAFSVTYGGDPLDSGDLFDWAILCNQEQYLEEKANQLVCTKERLSSAARLGSLGIIKLLLEKCVFVEERAILTAFKDATLCGHTDIALFLHEKIIEQGIDTTSKDYKNTLHTALVSVMRNKHKTTFKAILEISQYVNFDLNYQEPYYVDISDYIFSWTNSWLSVIDVAAFQEDDAYLNLLLKAEENFNFAPVSVIRAISDNSYERLRHLLKKGAAFELENVIGYFNFRKSSKPFPELIKGEDCVKAILEKKKTNPYYHYDPRVDKLVKLTCYKDKIKNEWRTLWSIILQWLGISRPQDKEQKSRASQMLFDVMVGNASVTKLDELSPIEKAALENDPGSRLGTIYQSFFPEIKQMREGEEKNQALEENGSQINLHEVD